MVQQKNENKQFKQIELDIKKIKNEFANPNCYNCDGIGSYEALCVDDNNEWTQTYECFCVKRKKEKNKLFNKYNINKLLNNK